MYEKLIYLVRHGETDANLKHVYQGVSQDNSLNENGKGQAARLGQWLKKYYLPPDIILTSPAKRAVETACILHYGIFGQKSKPDLFIISEMHEVNHGDWEGISDHDAACVYPDAYHLWQKRPMDMAFPNGETMEEARARILKIWRHNILARTEKIIMVVGHGGVNFQILNHALESHKIRNLWQDNACLNIIEKDKNDELRVRLINSTAHLHTSLEAPK